MQLTHGAPKACDEAMAWPLTSRIVQVKSSVSFTKVECAVRTIV